MSKTIDERVVEMRFNNKDFESNVQTSLKTIDKLKESLNFDESTKSVEKFQDSLKHFSLDDIGRAVEGLSDKFNWGNIFKMELLSNVTEQIYSTITNVFNRIKGELHLEDVDPISNMLLGWGKYAEKTQSVATIMAATGESMEYVNEQMERLLYFSDETSYSFTDMSSNIGKFTANGIGLEDASTAMQGIATWAARSGQNAQTASRVMYNLAQAIGMGALKLQDWKSVELANMGTKEFKEMAIAAGLANGSLTRNAEGIAVLADGTENTLKQTTVTVENFRETLKEGWLDNQVLMDTLQEYGKAADLISNLHESTGLYASEIIELARNSRESNMSLKEFARALGYTEEEFLANKDGILDLKQAFDLLASDEYKFSLATYEAAQEARTFGDAMASVADAVSSGWMKTFELLFGGYEKAKVLWTDLATNLIEIFGRANDERNTLLEEANFSGWDKFAATLSDADLTMLDLERSMRNIMTDGQFRTLMGDAESFEEAVRNGRFSVEQLNRAIDDLPSTFERVKEVTGEVTDNYEEMTEWSWELRKGMYGWDEGHDYQVQKLMEAKNITKEYAEQVVTLSERHHELGRELTREEAAEWLTYTAATERLKETVNLTDEERDALKALTEELDKKGAQESFVNGLMNIGHIALETFNQIHDAIQGMFPPMTAAGLRDLANNFERVTGKILEFITESNTVRNVITALIFPFRVLADIVSMLFRLISPLGQVILAAFMPIVGIIDAFGAWLINIRETSNQLNPFKDIIDKVGEALQVLLGFVGQVAAKVGGFVKDKLIEKLSGPLEKLIDVFNKFKENKLKGLDDFIESIKNASVEEAADKIIDRLRNIYNTAQQILAPIANVFKTIKEHFEYLERSKRFSGMTTLQNVFETIRWTGLNAIQAIEDKLAELGVDVDKLKKRFEPITNFFTKLKDAIMAFVEPIANVFSTIKDHFDYLERTKQFTGFTTLQNVIETVRWAAVSAFKSIRDGLKEVGIDLDPLIQKFKNAFDTIKNFFADLKPAAGENIFTKLKNNITEGTGALGEFIKGLGVTLPKVLTGGGIALAGAGIIKFIKTLKDAKKDSKDGIIDKLKDSLNPLSDLFEKLKTATSSFNITSFAAGIGLLAVSLIALSFVPTERLAVSLGTLGVSLAGFIGTIAAVNKIMGDKGTFRLVGMGLGMVAIASSLLLFASALNAFKNIDIQSNRDVQKIFGALLAAVVSMKALAKAAGKNSFKFSNGLALVATAGALWMFGKALESYANLKLNEKNIEKALSALILAVGSMAGLAYVVGKNEFKLSNGLGLVAMAVSMLLFASVVKKLGELDLATLAKGIISVGLLITMATLSLWFLADAGRAIGGKAGLGQFAMLIGLAVAIVAFGGVAALLGNVPVNKLTNGITAVGLLSAIIAGLAYFVSKIGDQTSAKGAIKGVFLFIGVVAAITALAVVIAGIGLLILPVALGCAALLVIIGELTLVFLMIKKLIAPNIKEAILGVVAIGLFGLALIPMVSALTDLGKLNFKKTQKNLLLLGELFLGFVALIGVATLVGGLATAAGPILLVGMGVVAGIFALFVGAITVLVKDLERLAALDTNAARDGLECVREELNILTDLAREFQENEGLFTASLGAALVCSAFGSGLHKLADDTMILGLANADRASASLKVVQEEIDLMTNLGEQLAQNEGSFSRGISASAIAFSFGVGLHGLANDTRILGLTNAENAKAAIEPMQELISTMVVLANTLGTDPTLFGKALTVSADMVAFGLGLLPIVGAEFIAGLTDAQNATANMGQIKSMIDMLFDIATQMGDDARLYFNAKATASVISEFGHALLPLVATDFVSQFVNAEASKEGFEPTKDMVAWLIEVAKQFDGQEAVAQGAEAAVKSMKQFATALLGLTASNFVSQFVSSESALEGLKPVQAIVDMLVGMVKDFSATESMTATAQAAVESVKTFASTLVDLMWSLGNGTWQAVDPASITSVIDAIVSGITQLTSINGDMASISAALSGVGDIFDSIGNLGTTGGLFGKKSLDTSGITEAFAAIRDSLIDLGNTAVQEDVGTKIMNSLILPITNESATAVTAMSTLGQAMSDTIASFENAFQVDGNNLAVGFVNGINSRVQDAYNAGYNLASEAERGTRDAGEIASPSKVFRELGGFVGEGFVDGIESKYGQISETGQAMVEQAMAIVQSLKDRMQALLADKANEMHITPVVDMTDVSSLRDMMNSVQGARSFGSYQINSEVMDRGIQSKSVMPELKSLHEHLAQLGEHMDNLQIVLDSGQLVGATSAKMDSQFGIMSMRRGRGN